MVQLSDAKEKMQDSMANSAEQNLAVGMVLILTACFCSGFASVYFERIVKQGGSSRQQSQKDATRKPSVWVQNAQLAGFTVLINMCGIMSEQLMATNAPNLKFEPPVSRGLLHGFTP